MRGRTFAHSQHEENCWGSVSFIDCFSFARFAGEWEIVNTTFAHTGGKMPAV